jgi:hypothetical protein
MSDNEISRTYAAMRKLTKECLDVTRERLRRGERLKQSAVARNAMLGIRGAL